MKTAFYVLFYVVLTGAFCLLFAGIQWPSATIFSVVTFLLVGVGGTAFLLFVDDDLRDDALKIVVIGAVFVAVSGVVVAAFLTPQVRALSLGGWSSDKVLRAALKSENADVVETACTVLSTKKNRRRAAIDTLIENPRVAGTLCVLESADPGLQKTLFDRWSASIFLPSGSVKHVRAVVQMEKILPLQSQDIMLDCSIRATKPDVQTLCFENLRKTPKEIFDSRPSWWVIREGAADRFVESFSGFESSRVPQMSEPETKVIVFELSCATLAVTDERQGPKRGRKNLREVMMGWLQHEKCFDDKLQPAQTLNEVCYETFTAVAFDDEVCKTLKRVSIETAELLNQALEDGKEMKAVSKNIQALPGKSIAEFLNEDADEAARKAQIAKWKADPQVGGLMKVMEHQRRTGKLASPKQEPAKR